MRKIYALFAVLVLCLVALIGLYALTKNTHPESQDLPQNTTNPGTNMNNSSNDKSQGVIYFGIMYEKNYSILGIEYTSHTLITDAKVSLYQVSETNFTDRHLLNIPENPLFSANAVKQGSEGTYYKFKSVPYGNYYITAEKSGNIRAMPIILNAASDGDIFGTAVFNSDLS